MTVLRTARLLMREWKDDDVDPIARMVEDPRVGKYLSKFRNRAAVQAWIEAEREQFRRKGYGLFAVERSDPPEFVGFCGLTDVDYEAHFTPAVEIGWRLQPDCWGHGYASEAAAAVLDFGFEALKLNEIVANSSVDNLASRIVMERIGMSHDPKDDFDHPLKAPDDVLRRQVLYRITLQDWHRRRQAQLAPSSPVFGNAGG
ncbi:GNAT family N-acetyltransferase [Mesorhizobium australicum]|uniref:GNAT family N-acetyltransferase n=1 Tax=Mesorhizobium australicum TaxID=536018 RepID=UPI00333E1862